MPFLDANISGQLYVSLAVNIYASLRSMYILVLTERQDVSYIVIALVSLLS